MQPLLYEAHTVILNTVLFKFIMNKVKSSSAMFLVVFKKTMNQERPLHFKNSVYLFHWELQHFPQLFSFIDKAKWPLVCSNLKMAAHPFTDGICFIGGMPINSVGNLLLVARLLLQSILMQLFFSSTHKLIHISFCIL